ncbi:MAG: hypothetical protein WDA06_05850 [Phenylobacterium sp.]
MKILLINLGSIADCLISSSIIKQFDADFVVITADKDNELVFKYNTKVKACYNINNLPLNFLDNNFDILFNYSYNIDGYILQNIQANEKRGFLFSKKTEDFMKILYGNKRTHLNMFEIYYSLVDERWRGQGYDFNYYPSCKTGKNKTGLFVSNLNLKNYITSKLKLNDSKLWIIPYRKNLFKRVDEINKCSTVVTDDFLTMNIANYLRKGIFFLQTMPFNFKLEMFGRGSIYHIPKNIIK